MLRNAHRGHVIASGAAALLCLAGCAAILIGTVSLAGFCQQGYSQPCMGGIPSVELALQIVLAGAVLGAALLARRLVRSRSFALASTTLVIAFLFFASWAVVLDAATHGWDNLKLLWLG